MHFENKEQPLMTFLVLAYNQQRFIREAVEGAFAQTYSPLEIILSDDCSTDGTFEIMQEMATSYRGSHSVKLNRTAKNKGLAAHVNSAMSLVAGELVVFAAGDDCSLPHRVETLTSEWIRSGKPSGISSEVRIIDEHGKLLEPSGGATALNRLLKNTTRDDMLRQFVKNRNFTLSGCSAAWSMETWDKFGHLNEAVVNEDCVLSFRSILDRGLHIIEEPLVLYRRHANNIWNTPVPSLTPTPDYYRSSAEQVAKWTAVLWMVHQNALSDLKTAVSKNMLDSATAQALEVEDMKTMRRQEIQSKWWDLPFFKRLYLLPYSPHCGFPLNVISLLPLNQYAALRALLKQIKTGLF